jgi:hypothetical protein
MENEIAQDNDAAGGSLWNQDFILSVEEQFRPRRNLVKGSCMQDLRDHAYVVLLCFPLQGVYRFESLRHPQKWVMA